MISTTETRSQILRAAITLFGRLGFKKSSIEEIARAANLSKQGLYLHFCGKEEVFVAAMHKYLDDGLVLVSQELNRSESTLFLRLLGAMDAWFGRHLETFHPSSFDIIEAGDRLSAPRIEKYKTAFQEELSHVLANSAEFKETKGVCSPKEVAQVLFLCGMSWKYGRQTRAEFRKRMSICIKACCQIER